MTDLANIKLKKNHSINFNFNRNDKVKKLLILGNTIHFFGFSENNKLDLMSMNDNDRNHLMWLIYQLKTNKTEIYIIGEAEEKEHYINLFNSIGSQFYFKINWKFLETKEPKDYLEKLSLLKNMKFDYIVGNPPFGSVGGDTLHLKCVDKVYDLFTKKMLMIMPFGFVTKDTKSFNKFREKFFNKLYYVKEITGNNFEGTAMFSAAIYEFNNDNSLKVIIEDITGNKIEKIDLTKISKFSEYENNIIQYLSINGSQLFKWAGGHDHCTKKSLIRQGIIDDNEIKNKINENILYNCRHIKCYDNKIFLLVNVANGRMNGTYISSKAGLIFDKLDDLINLFIERSNSTGYNVGIFNSIKEAEHCKIALQNPLLRFTCFKTQNDQNMAIPKVYKYIPNINWTDERCLTDEGLLEICGCPKDKAKEYAEYVKNYVEERDKEFENRKKKK